MKKLMLILFLAASSASASYYTLRLGSELSESVPGLLWDGATLRSTSGGITMSLGSPDLVSVFKTDLPIVGEAPADAEVITVVQADAETRAVIEAIVSQTLAIAVKYGVTEQPINWFLVDANIDAAAESEDPLVAMGAMKDAIRLNKNTMFLSAWGVDLFAVSAGE
jgi:hypothetical protein